MEKLLRELDSLWQKFLSHPIAATFSQHVPTFREWLRDRGVQIILSKAVGAASRGSSVAQNWAEEYAVGLVRRGGDRVLVNLFAAWLVHNNITTQYHLIKRKYVAGGESIATWLRVLRNSGNS